MGWVWYGLGLVWVGFGMGWIWYGLGLVWVGFGIGLVWFGIDEGLETILGIRDLEIYILFIYQAIKLLHL